jgi:hypothetical protein
MVLCVLVVVFLSSKEKMKDSSRRTDSLNCPQDIMIHVIGGLNINMSETSSVRNMKVDIQKL